MAHAPGERARAFGLSWLSYASYYLTRKNLSAAKTSVMEERGVSKQELAHLDTGYLAAYAGGQFLFGFLADRVGSRWVVGLGMLATATLSVLFARASVVPVMVLVWTLNGLAQSTGWSANVKAMSEVPAPGRRGQVMGWWTTNYVVGGFLATPIAAYCLHRAGVFGAFTYPAIIVATVGLAVLVFLPRWAGAAHPARDAGERVAGRASRREAWGLVLRSGRVWILGASYFFMKLARYALLFWLPFYGETALGYGKTTANLVSIAFEVGGAAGAITIGLLSDRLFGGRRFQVGIAALVGLGLALASYGSISQLGVAANVACLATIGFFLFGPDAILSGASAQDLGGPAAAAAAAGLINGMGSIGPIFGSELWTGFSTRYGWNAAFALLGGGALLSALILLPVRRVRPQGTA